MQTLRPFRALASLMKDAAGRARRRGAPGSRGVFSILAGLGLFLPGSPSACDGAERATADPEYTIQRWTVDDGLPQIGVRALAQTPDGYLWVGTFRGLARFDGVRFENFTVGNVPEMASDYIHALSADASGVLWVSAFEKDSLRLEDGGFRVLTPRSRSITGSLKRFATGKDGRTFGIVGDRLVLIEGSDVLSAADRSWLPARPMGTVATDREGVVWAAGSDQLYRVKGDSLEPVPLGGIPQGAQLLAFAVDGAIWAANREGLFLARHGTFLHQEGMVPGGGSALVAAGNGDIWVATREGLFRVRDGQARRIVINDGGIEPELHCLAEDRQGNMWAGSEQTGLYRVSPKRITGFRTRETEPAMGGINTLVEDAEGRAVMGSGRGLFRFQNGRFESLDPPQAGRRYQTAALARQPDGVWWIGSYGQGIFRGEPGRWARYTNSFVGDGFWTDTFYLDRDGSVWISGSKLVIRDQAGQVTRHRPEEPAMRSVHAIRRDRRGALWFGTHGDGLLRESSEGIRRWRQADGLGSDTVHGFLEDSAGRFWIGTGGSGLVLAQGDRLQRWTTASGLRGNVILQMHEDDAGYLWMGTEEGISRLRPQDLLDQAAGKVARVHPLRLGRADGAPFDQCDFTTSPAGLQQRDGRLWFCMPAGLAVVDPKQIHPEPTLPGVIIEAVRANGSATSVPLGAPAGSGAARSVELGPGLDQLEIQYTGFEFVAPADIRFRYRLEGLDRQWVDAGPRRTAYYTHIPPGRYVFRVLAANRDHVWNEQGARLELTVAPHFWETGAFRGVVGLLALAGVGLVIRHLSQRRLKRRLEQLEHQRALERERTRIARDMHDDVGARLTEIALLTDLAKRDAANTNDSDAQTQIDRIGSLTREVAKSVREVVWATNPQNDRLDQLTEYVCQHAGQFLQSTPMRLRLDVAAEIPEMPIGTELRHHLFLAFKEALNNAARHSGATEIQVRIACAAEAFSLEVVDNGHGFDASQLSGTGNGLKNMAQRLAETGGTCEVKGRPGQGTRVRFTIPLPTGARPDSGDGRDAPGR